ncbi:MAG: HutD family protein [Actinomycetota bacterium]
MPWQNGGGTTREFFREPSGELPVEWRLSVAEVTSDGPFSIFPGVDRILVLLAGEGMTLASSEWSVRVDVPLRCVEFPGDLAIEATLVSGATLDLNLMWSRDAWRATSVVRVGPLDMVMGGTGEVHVAYVAEGSVHVDGTLLRRGEAAVWTSAVSLHGDVSIALFTLTPLRDRPPVQPVSSVSA